MEQYKNNNGPNPFGEGPLRGWYFPNRRHHLSVCQPDDRTQLIVETFRGRYRIRIIRDGKTIYSVKGLGDGFMGRQQADDAYDRLEETGTPE